MVNSRGKVLALLSKLFLNHFEDGGLVLLIESISCQKQMYKLAEAFLTKVYFTIIV